MRWEPDPMGGLSTSPSDLDNARLMLRSADDNLRWRREDARWTVWDGQRWGSDGLRFAYTLEAIDVLYKIVEHQLALGVAPGSDMLDDLYQKIAVLKSARGNSNLWKMMLHLPGIVRDNEEFDADPYFINTHSGIVDLRTGDLLPHDKKHLQSKLTACEYDPNAEAKKTEAKTIATKMLDAEGKDLEGLIKQIVNNGFTIQRHTQPQNMTDWLKEHVRAQGQNPPPEDGRERSARPLPA
jgi:putative DNA primase/helicase